MVVLQTVSTLQDIKQLRGDGVAKVSQCVLQLGTIDSARMIGVEFVKDALPVLGGAISQR